MRPFGLSWEDEGGLDSRDETEGEERRVEVWMRRCDLRVVILAWRAAISVSSGEGVGAVDEGVGEDMVMCVVRPTFGGEQLGVVDASMMMCATLIIVRVDV